MKKREKEEIKNTYQERERLGLGRKYDGRSDFGEKNVFRSRERDRDI